MLFEEIPHIEEHVQPYNKDFFDFMNAEMVILWASPGDSDTYLKITTFFFDDVTVSNCDGRPSVHLGEGEVIIYFGDFHTHFDSWGGEKLEDEYFVESIELIELILNDEVAVISKPSGFSSIPHINQLDECINKFYKDVDYKIRSWSGKYNKDHIEQ